MAQPQTTVRKLVYARADARGIKITSGSDPRYGGSSKGIRTVVFPDGRCYDYRDGIESIGLRLGLITKAECDGVYLASGLYSLCGCGAVCLSDGFFATYGYCGNCDHRPARS